MSHIDSYKHEFVGYFVALPVYHILDECPENEECLDDYDFHVGPRTLVAGGGSGEHPGLIIRSPEYAVAEYFLHVVDGREEDIGITDKEMASLKSIMEKNGASSRVVFADWEDEQRERFLNNCKSGGLPTPFYDQGGISFEQWVHISFGEFIFRAFPEMAQHVVDLIKPYDQFWFGFGPNILLAPPGQPNYANQGSAFNVTRRNL